MGAEFQDIFGGWVSKTEVGDPNDLDRLALDLFQNRLRLAQKYNTFFARQVTNDGTDELWRKRLNGVQDIPCHSFATREVDRTLRFFHWTAIQNSVETFDSYRHWDTSFCPYPSLPGQVKPKERMEVWTHLYRPHFDARDGGAFACRRMTYGFNESGAWYLFEHPRTKWIPQLYNEAKCFWYLAHQECGDMSRQCQSLASFEWLWYWMNPFMRAGALTGDALSLIMQKHIGCQTRNFFYHQDCEALLLPFDEYVKKRVNDMLHGFVPTFSMDVAKYP